jgi:hypothetical protein
LAFREFALRVRLLANILGGAPHPRSESGTHRDSFLTGYTFQRRAVYQKCRSYVKRKLGDWVGIQSLSGHFSSFKRWSVGSGSDLFALVAQHRVDGLVMDALDLPLFQREWPGWDRLAFSMNSRSGYLYPALTGLWRLLKQKAAT